ncbi:hypothetical protein L6164_006932 [Bauhinia variegata]|uniref:Uncharacterized protein n=1 Tax=Bauhinia variegata TaxID=167791 RepID=A0ACB9PV67_BAUVA|nr:hypothetical protein L6164_006932 [Bauhinia variegata]
MTTYGTISQEPDNQLFMSGTEEGMRRLLGTRKPWMEMLQPRHIRLPSSLNELIQRMRTNIGFFLANYLIIILLILFLSLLWHPVSLIIYIIIMAVWIWLYFLRNDPLVVLGFLVDDRMVVVLLLFFTIGVLFLTNVKDVIVGICVGVVAVLVHAVMRDTEDQHQQDGVAVATPASARKVVKVPLNPAGSSLFILT